MIVGENARAEDLDVNATKEKQQTNMRAASADVLVRLAPPTRLSLEARARVPARGRVRRNHARVGPPAQGRARQAHAPEGLEAARQGACALTASIQPPWLEQASNSADHLLWFAFQPRSGNTGHRDPRQQQILLALAIALEGGASAVRLEDVEFNREAEFGPIAVELEPLAT